MEVESASRRLLLSDATVNGYVVSKVFKYRLEEKVDGTAGRAIVVRRSNGWARPDSINTSEYPILQVQCYADPDREPLTGAITTLNAEDKAWAVYRAVDRLMHGKRGVRWGAFGSDPGLMVVSSARWGEPFVVTDHDLHGTGTADPLGDSLYVMAQYALNVAH